MTAVVAGVFVAGFTDVAIRGMPELYVRARLALLWLRPCCGWFDSGVRYDVLVELSGEEVEKLNAVSA